MQNKMPGLMHDKKAEKSVKKQKAGAQNFVLPPFIFPSRSAIRMKFTNGAKSTRPRDVESSTKVYLRLTKDCIF
ncbi:MAG TPA: hypothetical protein DDY70_02980 [Clostridiales bacterium]|nr:hypothetical protein [Clostridiales bacterium]